MANQLLPAGQGERGIDGWLMIDDFSPGIYDNTFIAGEDPQLPAPFGACAAETTWCCSALSKGGLGPLPSLSQTYEYSPGFPGAVSEWFITGFIMNPGLNANGPEAVIILEGDDGTTHYVLGWSTLPNAGSSNIILNSSSGSTGGGIFGAPYPAFTRMTVDPSSTNPPPVLVFPGAVSTDASGVSGHLYIYPPILAPTTFAVQDLIVAHSSTTGQVVCYGERVQVLSGIDYPWPAGGGINTNENINYTDPPLSSFYGDQMTILGAEVPWGYGAWGSISVGELLLVKKYGGAVILYGDIAAPSSVISVPGVESTGDFVGRADATSTGLIYCAQNQGAWIWNGNNTAQKISTQLRDNFYDVSTNVILSNNYGFYVGHWQDWVLFSGNKMYVPETGSWWNLFPRSGVDTPQIVGLDLFWFSVGANANEMYAAPLHFGPGDIWYVKFDSTVPAKHWQWTSLPNKVTATRSHVVDVVQVMVTLSSPDGTFPTATVQIGSWTSPTLTGIGTEPTPFRLNAGALGLENVVVQVNGDNARGSAPILHSVSVGYKTRAPRASGQLMSILSGLRQLLIPRKGSADVTDLDTNWRAIETWAKNVGGIRSLIAGDNVTIENPDGPSPTINANATGGGYASLTGPGETVSPGALSQEGDFSVLGATSFSGGSFQASAPTNGDALLAAGAGVDSSSFLVNGNTGVRDPGTVSFSGGGGSEVGVPIQCVGVTVAPTFSLAHETYAFLIGPVGHIYYNPGGGSTWTLLV